MKNKPKQITISVKKYATGGQLKAQNNAGMNPYLYSSLPQYGLGSWLAENAGTIGTVAGGVLGAALTPIAGPAGIMMGASLGSSIGGSIGGAVTNSHNQGEANDQKAQQVALQQQQMSQQNAMSNYNAQQHPMYGTNFAVGGFMPNVNTWQYSNVGGMNYACGGKMYEEGGDIVANKPIKDTNNIESNYIGKWLAERKSTGRYDDQLNPDEYNRQTSFLNATRQVSPSEFYKGFLESNKAKKPSNLDVSKAVISNKISGEIGAYDPINRTIYGEPGSTTVHEFTHALQPTGQTSKILNVINSDTERKYDRYYDDPNEIYSRLMQFRFNNNINPNKIYSIDEINSYKKNKKFSGDKLFNRYTPEQLQYLLNDIAQNKNNLSKYNNTNMAAYGGMLSNYANGGQLGNDNNAAQMTKGLDNITVYPKSAGTHENSKYSGVKVGNKGLTEGKEVRWKNYVFSDRF